MLDAENYKDIAAFLEKNPGVLALLKDPEKREALSFLCKEDLTRIDYLIKNPWIDLEKIVSIADGIMNISPDIPPDELLNRLCRDTAMLTDAKSATCRTYDPMKNSMVASGAYNWNVPRTKEITGEDSVAHRVMKTKTHYCVPDIRFEPMYKEKDKILSMGLHAMLAIPIELNDFEGAEKRSVLIGTLQLYFDEENKQFYPDQIKLIKSIVSRFSYVMAQKRKYALQQRSAIIQESRKALIAILKRTQSLDQVLNFLVAKIAQTINVHRCSLFSIEREPAGDPFAVLIAGYPLAPFAHKYGITLSFEQHPAFRQVCETGKALLIEEAQSDPRMKASYELYLQKKIENVYFVPIKDEQDLVTNVLVLDGDETRPLENDDLLFCNALIQDIELCIQASIRSQERHDFFNQMLSFGAIAKLYTKKVESAKAEPKELSMLQRKLTRSMHAVNDIITDRVPFAQKERFNLNEVVRERFEAYFFPPGVVVEHNIDETSIDIFADRRKVGRIVGNLLDNAHKKLEELQEGSLVLRVSAESGFGVIEVGNNGSIPGEVQETIFQESKLPTAQNSPQGRLGLSIVKLFTLMHNGTVTFESSPEYNWTMFKVMLPLGEET